MHRKAALSEHFRRLGLGLVFAMGCGNAGSSATDGEGADGTGIGTSLVLESVRGSDYSNGISLHAVLIFPRVPRVRIEVGIEREKIEGEEGRSSTLWPPKAAEKNKYWPFVFKLLLLRKYTTHAIPYLREFLCPVVEKSDFYR